MEFLHTVFITILTLGILVTIHEWGHFYVARRCGIKVLKFSIGFGKALYTWRDRQGTEFAIAAIPLGGYVKMLDEGEAEVAPEQLDQAFNRKPVLQRMAVVAAGPAVNLIFAVLAYWFMYQSGVSTVVPVVGTLIEGSIADTANIPVNSEILSVDGDETLSWDEVNLKLASRVGESGSLVLTVRPVDKVNAVPEEYAVDLKKWHIDLENESPLTALGLVPWRPAVPAIIGRLVEDGRAKAAGLQLGDKVVSVNADVVDDWYALVDVVRASPNTQLTLQVQRGVELRELVLSPALKVDQAGGSYGYIGAAAQPVDWPQEYKRELHYGFFDALIKAFNKTLQMISLTLDSIWKMIEGVISVKNLSGPITIAKVASASAASGLESYVSFLAYLSISLGILNLLPIPVLDGGHLLYYTVELLRGKPVSERVQFLGLKIGMAMLLTLMLVALFNDFMRL